MTGNFIDNAQESRFEYHINDQIAYADYRIDGATLYIDYVFAPPELRGTGAASTLMQHICDHAMPKNMTIEPICGYAASWLQRHKKD